MQDADRRVRGCANRRLELIQEQSLGFVQYINRHALCLPLSREGDQSFGHTVGHDPDPDTGPPCVTGPYIHSSRGACR